MTSIIVASLLIITCLSIVVGVYFIFTLLSARRCLDAITELTLDIREDWPQIREKALGIMNKSDEVVKKVHNILEDSTIKKRIISPIITVFSIAAGIKAGAKMIFKLLSRR